MTPEVAQEAALLGRLLDTGRCVEAKRTKALLGRFQTARWVQRGRRRFEWLMRTGANDEMRARLCAILPTWKRDFALLRERGHDPFDVSDLLLTPSLRAGATAEGRTFLNRRNWHAAAGAGPKRTARRIADTVLTQDWALRLRWNSGLRIVSQGCEREANDWSLDGIEVVLTERAFLRGVAFRGVMPKAIFTCENLGAYIDLPLPANTLAAFSPGKDVRAAAALLERLPEIPWLHFGDLDPEGAAIAVNIAGKTRRPLRLFVPSFADEYIERAQKRGVEWLGARGEHLAAPIFAALRQQGTGIFQEVFMLDSRLEAELAREITG